ncbi:MAG: DUF1844 domain-containing protein [Deltaproteobacteria bacterium]|nr:DUF1844 domain-containing protein [Deltaproteobacteria bacterium]MCL5792036.1 DUF1844 domain-containing protein [Deltaproteobacteria bacterium]
MEEKKDDEIKVTDKRRFKMEEDGKAAAADKNEVNDMPENNESLKDEGSLIEDEKQEQDIGDYKLSFIDLINSLAGTALIQLGVVTDPATNKLQKDVKAAKQTIDIIEILKEKTKGNLANEESMILDNVLFDLRMRYIATQK